MKVLCPTCKSETEYSVQNPLRPFCSERCKLIDLGDWAEEKFRIPSQEKIQDLEEEISDQDA